MKKLIIIASMAIGTFGAFEAQAQYVEKVGGNIYIDVRDMPAGAWSNSTLNSDHNEPSAYNTLFKRIEVAASDEALSLTWDVAKAVCAAKGAGWRLPTSRELTLMYTLKDVLLAASATPFASTPYCSRTVKSVDATMFWGINMPSGNAIDLSKTNISFRVRCVREVIN